MERFIKAIFCAPTGEYKEYNLVSRLTDEVFQNLKNIGTNRIFGFGFDDRKETLLKTLSLCEKYDIDYLPSLSSFNPYVRLKKENVKSFDELSLEEINNIDNALIKEVESYLKFKAFKGVFFSDEAGYLSFNGIAHAKKVFSENFPNLEFHFNFFSYSINEAIFWGGMELSRDPNIPIEKPFKLDENNIICFKNRFNYYDLLVNHLLSQTKFEYLSQDKYPFELFWPSVPTSVHVGLFELNGFFAEKKREYGFNFYNYLQAGQWFYSKERKKMKKGEMLLQTNVTIGYGHEGYAYFPGCFPIDYIFDNSTKKTQFGLAGLIDINGNKGHVYNWVKEENDFISQIESDLLSSEFLGVTQIGKYQNGFKEKDIINLPDNECIFRGKLPNFVRYKSKNINLKANNEVMVSTFKKDNNESYFLTNLSSVFSNKIEIKLKNKNYILYRGKRNKVIKNSIKLTLAPGEAIYIKKIK